MIVPVSIQLLICSSIIGIIVSAIVYCHLKKVSFDDTGKLIIAVG
jgi:hypothetical protein